jgi:L-ascorbate metabolism protein UlaG (beta-lactamase superfamily)
MVQTAAVAIGAIGAVSLGAYATGTAIAAPDTRTAQQILPAAEMPLRAGDVRATFLGTTTILFDDGATQLLVDGFFSRPNALSVALGRIQPDAERIRDGRTRGGVGRPAAVLVAHAHFDHAMDAADILAGTNDLLIGSASAANVARGRDLPERQIRVVKGGERFQLGCFGVTVVPSPHSYPVRYEGEIAAPLRPPAKAEDYKEGGNFSFLVEHRGRRLLIHPSANFKPGQFGERTADIVFLGIGGLGTKDEAFTRDYWTEVVANRKAAWVFPVHWDNFTRPLSQELRPVPWPLDNYRLTLQRLQAHANAPGGAKVATLPPLRAVDLPLRPPAEGLCPPRSSSGRGDPDATATAPREENRPQG